ncbi:hypothetical protein [Pseudomonas sp. Irchel 3E13]|uniref:hypothetical protein n=1 Tax=Pseudomonas sp. Irchel 3E13 TaxID=2008975 RepID=UPI000BA4C142|nr:hypothetical protein [Pseudomonas sp. Irchel 3E13]
MTLTDVVGIIETIMWAGLWFWIARHLKHKGRGALLRHITGFSAGGLLTWGLFTVLFYTGSLPPNPKTFDLTPEQYAARLNPLLQEWEHQPRMDPTHIIDEGRYTIVQTPLAPGITLVVNVSKMDGKVFFITVEGLYRRDLGSFGDLKRLASVAVAATQAGTVSDEVIAPLSKLEDGPTVILAGAKVKRESKDEVGMNFYLDPL